MLRERPVSFPSEGAMLRGLLISDPSRPGRRPLVVMAHGTSATFPMVAVEYARVFARAGITALIYDHRNFGVSEGEPRFEINPWVQCRGYRDALGYASTLEEIDPERMALWSDSYTGGQVVVLSACDPRPKVMVAQCPVFGATVPDRSPSPEVMARIRATLDGGDVSATPAARVGPLPVVSSSQLACKSLLTPIQAFRWFIEYGGRPGSGWVNEVSRLIPDTPVTYSPFLCAPFVQASAMFMVAPDDEMVHADYGVARQAYNLVPTDKCWHDIADGHFGLLCYPSERFEEASALQADFLHAKLLR
jgi:hypothetical protein